MTITEFIVAIIAAGAVGSISTAIINWRKVKPEMKRIAAEADEIQTRGWKVLTDSLEGRLAALNTEIEQMRQARENTRTYTDKRIYDLQCDLEKLREAKASADAENEKLRLRVLELEAKVTALETELGLWKSGEKKKTGPLA